VLVHVIQKLQPCEQTSPAFLPCRHLRQVEGSRANCKSFDKWRIQHFCIIQDRNIQSYLSVAAIPGRHQCDLVQMSRRPLQSGRHQSTFEISNDADLDDADSDEAVAGDNIAPGLSGLSESAQRFSLIKLGDHEGCKTFIQRNRRILGEDADDFLKAVQTALRAGRGPLAQRCVQQALLIEELQGKRDDEVERYLRSLIRHAEEFEEEYTKDFEKVERQVFVSVLRLFPPATTADQKQDDCNTSNSLSSLFSEWIRCHAIPLCRTGTLNRTVSSYLFNTGHTANGPPPTVCTY
jgi:hypothetical protein